MRNLIIALFMVAMTATPIAAQEATLAVEGDVKALQEQIASIIKARGEDAKTIIELQNQIRSLQTRTPAVDAEEQAKKAKESFVTLCKSMDLKFDEIRINVTDGSRTIICK